MQLSDRSAAVSVVVVAATVVAVVVVDEVVVDVVPLASVVEVVEVGGTGASSSVVTWLKLSSGSESRIGLVTAAAFSAMVPAVPTTVYVATMVCDAPTGIVPRTHGNAVLHAPALARNSRPVGVGSVIMTSVASAGPALCTTIT